MRSRQVQNPWRRRKVAKAKRMIQGMKCVNMGGHTNRGLLMAINLRHHLEATDPELYPANLEPILSLVYLDPNTDGDKKLGQLTTTQEDADPRLWA